MFCPVCKAEYREGFYRCSDCDVPLVSSLPQAPLAVASSEEEELVLLWQGGDPVVYTTLVSALREAQIPFHDQPVRDYEAYLSSLPVGLYGGGGFAIRVMRSNLQSAQQVLADVLGQPSEKRDIEASSPFSFDATGDVPEAIPAERDAEEAVATVWSGEDAAMAQFVQDILRENAIPSRRLGEPPGAEHILVRPEDERRAREIVREVIKGAPPA